MTYKHKVLNNGSGRNLSRSKLPPTFSLVNFKEHFTLVCEVKFVGYSWGSSDSFLSYALKQMIKLLWYQWKTSEIFDSSKKNG